MIDAVLNFGLGVLVEAKPRDPDSICRWRCAYCGRERSFDPPPISTSYIMRPTCCGYSQMVPNKAARDYEEIIQRMFEDAARKRAQEALKDWPP